MRTAPTFRTPHGELNGLADGILSKVCACFDKKVLSMRAQWGLSTVHGMVKSPVRYDYYAGQIAPSAPFGEADLLSEKRFFSREDF